MTDTPRRGGERRQNALSRQRIVDTAIELLDSEGEDGLTFRVLAARLATGAGAIYWHVANKSELLAAAADSVLSRSLGGTPDGVEPADTIRSLALQLFDAMEVHPWIGPQLSRSPWQSAMRQIFELFGQQLDLAAIPVEAQFTATSALVYFVLGAGGQNAINTGIVAELRARDELRSRTRLEVLDDIARQWTAPDSTAHPHVNAMLASLRDHDDHEQFLAGVEFLLTGMGVVERAG